MKIGILFFLGLGNAVMFLPAIAALRRAHPSASITLYIRDPLVEVLLSSYDLDLNFKLFQRPESRLWRWLQRVRLLVTLKWVKVDILLSTIQAEGRERVMVKTARATKKFGIEMLMTEHDSLFDELSGSGDTVHESDRYQSLVALAGADASRDVPSLVIPPSARKIASELVPDSEGIRRIGIHSGSGGDLAYKRWSADKFAKLLEEISAKYRCEFYLFGGPEEEELARDLAKISQADCTILAGKTDLMGTLACLERCDFLISNDSGVSHLADVVGLKTVTLFGPTSEYKNRPTTEGSVIVRSDSTECAATRENICDVCEPRYLSGGEVPMCLQSLTVARVIGAVEELLI